MKKRGFTLIERVPSKGTEEVVEEGRKIRFTFREGYSERLKRLVRVKYPRAKSMKAIRLRMKETIKRLPLGTQLDEVIRKVNSMLRGWANYFRIGNSVVAALSLGNYACDQLRIFWRRRSISDGRSGPTATSINKAYSMLQIS